MSYRRIKLGVTHVRYVEPIGRRSCIYLRYGPAFIIDRGGMYCCKNERLRFYIIRRRSPYEHKQDASQDHFPKKNATLKYLFPNGNWKTGMPKRLSASKAFSVRHIAPPVHSTCPLQTITGFGKDRRILMSMVTPAKAALVRNYLEVYWPRAGGLSAVCMYVCMVITYSRVWINRVRLPILLVVS